MQLTTVTPSSSDDGSNRWAVIGGFKQSWKSYGGWMARSEPFWYKLEEAHLLPGLERQSSRSAGRESCASTPDFVHRKQFFPSAAIHLIGFCVAAFLPRRFHLGCIHSSTRRR